MALTRVSFTALVLVCATVAFQTPESARDQYKAHEDGLHPPQLLGEATDRGFTVQSAHRFSPLVKKLYKKSESPSLPELQVGCGEGSFDEKTEAQVNLQKQKLQKSHKLRMKREVEEKKRVQRAYWSPQIIQAPSIPNFGVWQPQYYQISRPYYIPIWGSHGSIPMYFPPQPFYVNNPGYPAVNPPNKPYLPPRGYLPPDTKPAPATEATMVTIDNKYGEIGNTQMTFGLEEAPVWDAVPNQVRTTTAPTPTRRTRPPGQLRTSTHPPILHKKNNTASNIGNQLAPPVIIETEEPQNFIQPQFETQTRPRSTQSPARPRPTQPSVKPQQQPPSNQPSRCVWAIISCCSASSVNVNYSCFEQLGCTGAFWDSTPCDSDFARAAIASAMNYYNK